MSYWMDFYFMDSSSPAMEQLIIFYDHSMIIIVSILFFLLCNIFMMMLFKKINLNLMENQSIELVWTFFPMFLLMFIAAPSLRLLYLMEEVFTPNLTVKIIGHQWYWSYEYSEFEVTFDCFMEKMENIEEEIVFRLLETDMYVALPVNAVVRFLVSSVDVIHSWSLQSLGLKIDAIPGRLNQMSAYIMRPGIYYGQCSEICGMNHSFMPISVKIMTMEDFIDMFF